jgi:hypothetical protein
LKYSPEQINYYSLKENKTLQDYVAPGELPISGTLIWKTSSGAPLPIIVIKAYAQDGSYFRPATTGVDGKYTLPVPFGWTGSVKPDNIFYVFDPEKMTYNCVGSGVSVADQNFRITKKP